MIFEPLPWNDYPSVTQDTLKVISDLIRDVHAGVAKLFDPKAGDSIWDRGCRAYSRRCNAIRRVVGDYNWLTIPSAQTGGLEFTFAIRGVPIKFYCGDAEKVPSRYQSTSYPELRSLKLAFESGEVPSQNAALRLAIENAPSGEVTKIMLVEVDTKTGEPIRVADIAAYDTEAGSTPPVSPVTPIGGLKEGVVLPPASIVPIGDETTEQERKADGIDR